MLSNPKYISIEELNTKSFSTILQEVKEEGYTTIYAKEYYTEILKYSILKNSIIPQEYYNLITPYKTLQAKITKEVITEFLKENISMLIEEIIYTKNLKYRESYYITSSCNTNNIEEIILKEFYIYYINDEYIGIKGRNKESQEFLKENFHYYKEK